MKFKTTPYHFDLLKDEKDFQHFTKLLRSYPPVRNWLMIWDAEVNFIFFSKFLF